MKPSDVARDTTIFWKKEPNLQGLRKALEITLDTTLYSAEEIVKIVDHLWPDYDPMAAETLKRFVHRAEPNTTTMQTFFNMNRVVIALNDIWGDPDSGTDFLDDEDCQQLWTRFRSALPNCRVSTRYSIDDADENDGINQARSGGKDSDSFNDAIRTFARGLNVEEQSFELFPKKAFAPGVGSHDEQDRPPEYKHMVIYSTGARPDEIYKAFVAIKRPALGSFSSFIRAYDFLGATKKTDGMVLFTGKTTYLLGTNYDNQQLEMLSLERAQLQNHRFKGVQICSDLKPILMAGGLVGYNVPDGAKLNGVRILDHNTANCRMFYRSEFDGELDFLSAICSDPDAELEYIKQELDYDAPGPSHFPF